MQKLINKPIKKKKYRWLLELFFFVVLFMTIRAWQQKDLVTGVAPNFHGEMLTGENINLTDYHGEPFIIHFWAKWCHFCRMEENSLSNIKQNWPFLSIAYQSGSQENVSNYMKERNIENWPTIIDSDNKIADLFSVNSVPTTYIIDANGNIRFAEVGLTSSWGIKARLWWATHF